MVKLHGDSDHTLNNVTMLNNASDNGHFGQAIHINAVTGTGNLKIDNSIVYSEETFGSSCIGDLSALATTSSNVGIDQSCESGNTWIITNELVLAPLAKTQGSRTQTHIPVSDLPIDVGNSSTCESEDQRGISRLAKDCDIGSVERKQNE